MTIPSGTGTEVLKRATSLGTTNNLNSLTTVLTVASNHIYTVLKIVVSENGSASELLTIKVTDADQSDQSVDLLINQPITSNETFIWGHKFVLDSGDLLRFQTGSASNMDIHISYIDQDWS